MVDAALAAEAESDPGAADSRMPVAQRCQAETAVGPGVFLVADADQGVLEQLDDGGEDFFAGRAATALVAPEPGPQPRQTPGEFNEPVVLRRVALVFPTRV